MKYISNNFKKVMLFTLFCFFVLFVSYVYPSYIHLENIEPTDLNPSLFYYFPENDNQIKDFSSIQGIYNQFSNFNSFPKSTKNTLVSLAVKLPEKEFYQPYLFFDTYNQNIQVFCMGKEIYRNFNNSLYEANHSGLISNQIELPEGCEGKVVFINLYSRFKFNFNTSTEFSKIYLNNADDMFVFNTFSFMPRLIIGLLLIFFSAFMLISTLIKNVNFSYFRSLPIMALNIAFVDLIKGFTFRNWIFDSNYFWYYCPILVLILPYAATDFAGQFISYMNAVTKVSIKKYRYISGLSGLIGVVIFVTLDYFGIFSFYSMFNIFYVYVNVYSAIFLFKVVKNLSISLGKVQYPLIAGIMCVLGSFIEHNEFITSKKVVGSALASSMLILIITLILNFFSEYKHKLKTLKAHSEELSYKSVELEQVNKSLAKTNEEINNLNQSLEVIIEEKTKELKDKYEELKLNNEYLDDINKEMEITNENLNTTNQTLEKFSEEKDKANKELYETLENLKIVQDELVQAEKYASLGSMVSGISHELNTPLGVCVTATSYLHDKLNEVKKKYQEKKLKQSDLNNFFNTLLESNSIVISNLENAISLITSFKKVSIEQTKDAEQIINLKEYINHMLRSLNPRLKKERHKIFVECADNLNIKSYPGIFMQILTNLIVNSLVHAYDEGDSGEINIRVIDNDGITIEYSDNGKGIPAATLPHIFNEYFTTGDSKVSTGLGLSIIKDLVENKLHGTIECSSTLGEGVKFTIKFYPERESIS